MGVICNGNKVLELESKEMLIKGRNIFFYDLNVIIDVGKNIWLNLSNFIFFS